MEKIRCSFKKVPHKYKSLAIDKDLLAKGDTVYFVSNLLRSNNNEINGL